MKEAVIVLNRLCTHIIHIIGYFLGESRLLWVTPRADPDVNDARIILAVERHHQNVTELRVQNARIRLNLK